MYAATSEGSLGWSSDPALSLEEHWHESKASQVPPPPPQLDKKGFGRVRCINEMFSYILSFSSTSMDSTAGWAGLTINLCCWKENLLQYPLFPGISYIPPGVVLSQVMDVPSKHYMDCLGNANRQLFQVIIPLILYFYISILKRNKWIFLQRIISFYKGGFYKVQKEMCPKLLRWKR